MVVDATARLYDVDEDSVVFTKLQQTQKYDQGTIEFHARKGKLISLEKLHESIWASRLSDGTRSGLVSLEVDVVGKVRTTDDKTLLQVAGTDEQFELCPHPDEEHAAAFENLLAGAGNNVIELSGRVDNYKGRWPTVLRRRPAKPRKILVTGFKIVP